jgi:hypothetical protein
MKGNKVVLRGRTDPFSGEAETEEFFISQIPYERIVISDKGYLSTGAINLLLQRVVDLLLDFSFMSSQRAKVCILDLGIQNLAVPRIKFFQKSQSRNRLL